MKVESDMEKMPIEYRNGGTLLADVKGIIDSGMAAAATSVSQIASLTYWRVGKRIVEEEQGGERRAEYGKHLIEDLSKARIPFYGDRYTPRRLRDYRLFFLQIPDFEIWHSRVPNLSWTHFRQILPVVNEDARYWYLREASRENWSVRTLSRNIGSQYYHRLLASRPRRNSAAKSSGRRKSSWSSMVNPPKARRRERRPPIAELATGNNEIGNITTMATLVTSRSGGV